MLPSGDLKVITKQIDKFFQVLPKNVIDKQLNILKSEILQILLTRKILSRHFRNKKISESFRISVLALDLQS